MADISNDRTSLINVVKALGEYLTSEESELLQKVLTSMGKPFLDGYTTLADGEKDPRNLMIAFAIARVILIEFDISQHTETMFNILFCYFPITFRPPPNDRYGITTDDLRTSLRRCLGATPAFGPLAIPVFLEKLTAGSRATKKDTLQTMAFCFPVYGSALGRAHARKLWNALKLEIFQPVDLQTEEEALRATQVLVKTIYADEEAAVESNDDVHGLARDACEECIQILKEPEKNQANAAIKILCSFISTTPSVSRYTISQAVPHLVKLFHNPDEAPTRVATLTLLAELLLAARDSQVKSRTSEAEPAVLHYKDEVLGVFTVGLQSTTLRVAALPGLKAMASTDRLLTDEELGFIVHRVGGVIESDLDGFEEASETILDLLTTISDRAPRHIFEQTLPLLFKSLPDKAPSREATAEREKCWQVLSALQTLCIQQELFENLVIRLTTKLDLICLPSHGSNGTIKDLELDAAFAHMILKTLAQTLLTKVKAGHPDVPKYVDQLLPRIFDIFISSAVLSTEQPMIATNSRLLNVAAEIITLVLQSLPPSRQQSYSMGLSKAIMDGDTTDIAQDFQKKSSARKLDFFGSSTMNERNLLALLAAAVIPLHKEVHLPIGDLDGFLDTLLAFVTEKADTDLQRLSALHMLSSILNRRADELSSFLQDKLNNFWDREVSDRSVSVQRRKSAIQAWTWISKALLVRKHPLAMNFAERLFDVFGDETIGWDAARAMGDIPAHDSVLNKANHAEIKILYVQKYVNTILPRLIQLARDANSPAERTAALVALTSVIKSIPRAAYIHEMPSLMPSFCYGALICPMPDIRCSVIDTFLAAAEGETPEKNMVSEHSSTLVNAMLRNIRAEKMASTKVRISALRYLGGLPSIVRYDILHPYKPTVLRELAKTLDDPKRSVRKAAVDARTNWFKYKG
ncbi:hypothetical protein NLJ89_g807 [Agrocybe chaxingu]|uniref:MMS19 nucleotide excision repair protein n=1 Tax=Agrocybe chaxingu TaxID=84603 RepID=A0A9W8N154_9AGAR|nr:hypothetical protein NLJ89_g807 [Agrocybe chaxingu]